MSVRIQTMLNHVLRVNAASCTLFGLLFVFAAPAIAHIVGDPPTLLLQVFEFPVTARQAIGAIEIVDTQRLITEPIGAFDQVARMRSSL